MGLLLFDAFLARILRGRGEGGSTKSAWAMMPFLEFYSAAFRLISVHLPFLSASGSPTPASSPLPSAIGGFLVLLPPFSSQLFLPKNKRKEETRSPLIQTGSGFSLHLHFLAGGVGG